MSISSALLTHNPFLCPRLNLTLTTSHFFPIYRFQNQFQMEDTIEENMSQQSNESKPDNLTILCFSSDVNSFQGHIIQHDGTQYGLMGKKTKPPTKPYHQCCFEEEPLFYRVTVIDYTRSREYVLKHVMKTNGDNCSLTCDDIEFHTDQLHVGKKAETMIQSYFSEKLQGKDCFVCTGQMVIQGELKKKLTEEQSDSDSDFWQICMSG